MRYIKKLISFAWEYKKKIVKYLGIALTASLFFVVGLFIYFGRDLPSPNNVAELYIPESAKILDRTETTVLYDIYEEQKRTVVAFEDMPQHIRDATVVAEDDNFYHHLGLDFKAIARAAWQNLKGGNITQGGSTITQQFVKNSLLSPERTISRKIKEAILSVELELKYSKNEILTFYLNQVPYGSNAYGVEAAANTFLGKHAKDLTTAESAVLAALPNAPSFYSPYGNNQDALFARQHMILNKMLTFGYITEEEYQRALAEKIVFQTDFKGIQAPHFVLYIREFLENKYGAAFVQQAGLRVITTLDKTIQDIAESAVVERGVFNEANFNARNASVVVIDPKIGQILAMVGSRDYFDLENDGNVNVSTRPRQPGSSFKPFAYAAAFQKGYTPDTVVFDVQTEFNPNCAWEGTQEKDQYGLDCYHPKNYDERFVGPITFKEALAQSRNVPAVKVLYLAGLKDTLELAGNMGISTLDDPSRFGLSLVLGGGEVTLLEETAAYGIFATRGIKNTSVGILRIEDRDGNIIEEFEKDGKRVLTEDVAGQINYILSENSFRAPIFGEQNSLHIDGLALAAKTGTTQEFRDAWVVGYTPSLVVGVWVGNNDNTAMINAPGVSAAAPIFRRIIQETYIEKQKELSVLKESIFYFKLPKIQEEQIFNPPDIKNTGRSVLDGDKSVTHTILHFINQNDPRGDIPSVPEQNVQYSNWERMVQVWLGKNGLLKVDLENNPIN